MYMNICNYHKKIKKHLPATFSQIYKLYFFGRMRGGRPDWIRMTFPYKGQLEKLTSCICTTLRIRVQQLCSDR